MTGRIRSRKVALVLFIIAACVFSAAPGAQAAGTPEFRLDLDSSNLQMGTGANLTVSLVNAQGAEIVEVSGLESFSILSSSQSTSTRVFNGAETYRQDLIYAIMPKTAGSFTLQGSIKYNGQTYQTNELKINVSEAEQAENDDAVEDVYVKTLLSDQEVYFGQKVVLTYELYTRYNIENFGFLDPTGIDGFIGSDIPREQLKSEIIEQGGKKYARYEVKQSILSPVKTGTFTIPAFNLQVNVSTGGFFDAAKAVYLQTEARQLTVKPLPPDNQPADFSGIVGQLSLESKIGNTTINYGDSVTLQVTASGNGNLDRLKEIVNGDMPGFSVFQTEKNKQETVENNRYASTKEFEIILVPKTNGELRLEPIAISYFDPETGRYEQAEIPGATITVLGEVPQAQAAGANGTAAAVETVSINQVSYNPQSEDYLTIRLGKDHLYMGAGILTLLLALAALAVWGYAYRKKYDRTLQLLYRKSMRSNDPAEIYNQFNSMIKHVYRISVKASPRQMIAQRLTDETLARPVMEIVDLMEQGKYRAGQSDSDLKAKIKGVYRLLKKQRGAANENQAVRFRA